MSDLQRVSPNRPSAATWRLREEIRFLLAALLASAMVLACMGTAAAARMGETIDDQEIVQAIDYRLLNDRAVFSNTIDVTVVEGVVTLEGTVDNLLSRDRAVSIARSVRGVRSVVDSIEVDPPVISERKLRRRVRNALLFDPVTESLEIEAEVDDAVVTLRGTVDSWAEKNTAAEVTRGVEGVRKIENDILIEYGAARSDAEIEREVSRRLDIDVYLIGADIEVEVRNGRVLLGGTANSPDQKFRAWSDSFVMGVRDVDDSAVKVVPSAPGAMTRPEPASAMRLSDQEVGKAVLDGLMFDPRVNSFRPTVSVRSGVVTLSGTVSNLAARRAAVETAGNTTGVWKVRDFLRVRPELVPSDDLLESRIDDAVIRDPFLELSEISVSARRGVVELHGAVDTAFEKEHATAVVSAISGVAWVDNYLEVRQDDASGMLEDWELERSVRRAILWSPYVDAEQVEVSVLDGVTTLTGQVDSWFERRMAVVNAREGGARIVRNKITIEDFSPDLFP